MWLYMSFIIKTANISCVLKGIILDFHEISVGDTFSRNKSTLNRLEVRTNSKLLNVMS